MALSQTTLSNALESAFNSYSTSKSDAANLIADAYATYAVAGRFGANVPNLTTQEAAFAATLLAGMNNTLASFCNAFQSGLTTFWTGVPVAGGGQAGTTVPPTGAATVSASLQSALSAFPATTALAASSIASVLHVCTLTTTAIVSPPPATVLPIT